MTRAAMVAGALLLLGGCHRLPQWSRPNRAALAVPGFPRIPRDASRFEIDSVTDSTATFGVREATWIRPGLQSYAVDPAQRDALVARLRILSRTGGSATAVVTGQVTRVRPEHFLLVVRPESPWWKSRVFWAGTVLGVTVGAGGTVLAR